MPLIRHFPCFCREWSALPRNRNIVTFDTVDSIMMAFFGKLLFIFKVFAVIYILLFQFLTCILFNYFYSGEGEIYQF